MLSAFLTSLAAKLAAGLVALAGVTAAASQITGTSPPTVFNTILNLVGAGVAVVVAQWVRDLKSKTESGDTPAAASSAVAVDQVTGLRQDISALRDELQAVVRAVGTRHDDHKDNPA